MKVLIVSNMYPSVERPHYGAFVETCAKGYRDNGLDVTVSAISHGGALEYFKFYFRTFVWCATRQYDLIHVHYVSHSFLPVAIASLFRRLKVVSNFHGSDAFPEVYEGYIRRKFKKLMCGWAIRKSAASVVPSEYFSKKMIDAYGMGRIIISPSGGVDESVFQFRNNLGRVVMFAGRMIPEKGGVLAATAMKENSEFIDRVVIVGDGPDLMQVKDILKGMSVDYHGMVSRGKLSELMSDSDVFLFPSSRDGESLGLVLVEAIFSGCIPLTLNNGAVGEIIPEQYADLLVVESEEYGSSLKRILTLDENDRKKIIEIMGGVVVNKYESKQVAKALVSEVVEL